MATQLYEAKSATDGKKCKDHEIKENKKKEREY